MRAVVQRVSQARVSVNGQVKGEIGVGLLVLLGIAGADSDDDVDYLARKIIGLRIFEDSTERMNLSVAEVKGSLLVVSQFTLFGDCRKGMRPSFTGAMEPVRASELCEKFVAACRAQSLNVQTGEFGAMMKVELCNEGPVTLLLDSTKLF